MRRTFMVTAVAILLVSACGDSGGDNAATDRGGGGGGDSVTTTLSGSISTTMVPTTANETSCFLRGLSQGLAVADIEQQCRLDAMIDDIVASVRMRDRIASYFNSIQPGFGMTAKDVVDWGERACTEGPQVIRELVGRVRPTPAQRAGLLSPLLDFASDAGANCTTRPRIRDDLASIAWSTAAGPTPTVSTAKDILKGQTTAPQVMIDLFKGAHSPCDVVGNAVIIGLKQWSNSSPPDWVELALGVFVGAVCNRVVAD